MLYYAGVALPTLLAFAVFTVFHKLIVATNRGYHGSRFLCGFRLQSTYRRGLGESLVFLAPMFPARGAPGFFIELVGSTWFYYNQPCGQVNMVYYKFFKESKMTKGQHGGVRPGSTIRPCVLIPHRL